jgi:hypothetical protein
LLKQVFHVGKKTIGGEDLAPSYSMCKKHVDAVVLYKHNCPICNPANAGQASLKTEQVANPPEMRRAPEVPKSASENNPVSVKKTKSKESIQEPSPTRAEKARKASEAIEDHVTVNMTSWAWASPPRTKKSQNVGEEIDNHVLLKMTLRPNRLEKAPEVAETANDHVPLKTPQSEVRQEPSAPETEKAPEVLEAVGNPAPVKKPRKKKSSQKEARQKSPKEKLPIDPPVDGVASQGPSL